MIESILNNMIFFPSVINGFFDYNIPLKSSLTNFEKDKTFEPSPSLFEYLCYKIIKKKIQEGKINKETILITENFLTSFYGKNILIKSNVASKKHIIIFLQNKETLKWNLIAFLDLERQLQNCFDLKKRKPIVAKIISSNENTDEDDFILNSTMDKLENTFEFKSPDDIQFEVDSINISDQPNTSIFLLNFIEGLIVKNDDDMQLYIKKLYDEGSNNLDQNSKNYFNSFNKINDVFENIYSSYQNEIDKYLKSNEKINSMSSKINLLEGEKIMNGCNKILNIDKNSNNEINFNNFLNKGSDSDIPNGMNYISINNEKNKKNEIKDEIDMIQIEQDDDLDDILNSEEEEEALKIMERENQEYKIQMREQERRLRQRLYKQKLRLKNINMYKEFGVIKEEENESESESIDLLSKIKEEERKIKNNSNDFKNPIKKSLELRKSRLNMRDNGKENKNIFVSNNNYDNKNNNEEELKENDNNIKEQKDNIKLSALKNLVEAIEEFEFEQDPMKASEENNGDSKNINIPINSQNNNNIIKDIGVKKENKENNENKDIKNENKVNEDNKSENNKENKNENIDIKGENKAEKKNNLKKETNLEEIKKDKDKINFNYINNNSLLIKYNIELKKRSSIPKEKSKPKEKEQIQEYKLLSFKNFGNLKKSSTSIKYQNKEKDKDKEKILEESLKIQKKRNSLDKKKPLIIKENNNNNTIKNTKSNNSSNSNKTKEKDNNSTNTNSSNVYNTSSFINNSKDQEKSSKEKENFIIREEPKDNLKRKISSIYINNTIREKNIKNIKNNLKNKKNNSELNLSTPRISINTKLTNNLKKSSISIKSESIHFHSQNNSYINKNSKQIKITNNKNNKDFSSMENPMNVLPPQKIVERNGFNDLNEKKKIENDKSYKINQKFELISLQSEKNNGDFNSNINIENILSEDFDSEKSNNEKYDYTEEYYENRTNKKTMIRKGDKKMKLKFPPGKSKTSHMSYNNQYCNMDEEGANKACGCIGEQVNGLCGIF